MIFFILRNFFILLFKVDALMLKKEIDNLSVKEKVKNDQDEIEVVMYSN
jgi:hypothetical protein